MIASLALFLATIVLGWANGANDVPKGIAALAGSGVASPRAAWLLGVAGTAAGGLAAVFLGGALSSLFSGGFLTSASSLSVESAFAALVGAAGFVLLATWRRWPVSTTHALIGGIVGAAIVQFGIQGVGFNAMLASFLIPLLLSPLLAIGLCWFLLRVNRMLETWRPQWTPGCCDPAAWERDPYICVRPEDRPSPLVCKGWLAMHWLTGGAVSFARGLNDTPKIAALMVPAFAAWPTLATAEQAPMLAVLVIAAAMTIGGYMSGQRLLPVLAEGVSSMNRTTGLFANMGTAFLVMAATPLGFPVSTTHIATGSLIGVRVADNAPPRTHDALYTILLAWLVTLPFSAVTAALVAVVIVS